MGEFESCLGCVRRSRARVVAIHRNETRRHESIRGLAIAANRVGKMERTASVFSQTNSGGFSLRQKMEEAARLPPMILMTSAENPLFQPIGALVESAVPLAVFRMVPL